MMNVITKQDLLDTVVEKWYQNYFRRRENRWSQGGPDKEVIYRQLVALNPPTEEAVNAIIGNSAWTSLRCDSCYKDVDAAVVLDVTGGEYTTYLCGECLRRGLDLLMQKEQRAT